MSQLPRICPVKSMGPREKHPEVHSLDLGSKIATPPVTRLTLPFVHMLSVSFVQLVERYLLSPKCSLENGLQLDGCGGEGKKR